MVLFRTSCEGEVVTIDGREVRKEREPVSLDEIQLSTDQAVVWLGQETVNRSEI